MEEHCDSPTNLIQYNDILPLIINHLLISESEYLFCCEEKLPRIMVSQITSQLTSDLLGQGAKYHCIKELYQITNLHKTKKTDV